MNASFRGSRHSHPHTSDDEILLIFIFACVMLTAPVTRAMRRLGDYVRERWAESDDTESEASDDEGEGESGESCSKNLC